MIPGNQFFPSVYVIDKDFLSCQSISSQSSVSRRTGILASLDETDTSHQYHSIDFKEVSDERIFFR